MLNVHKPVALQASASTWQMIAASCLTALGALCGQLTFQLAWCRQTLSSYGDRTLIRLYYITLHYSDKCFREKNFNQTTADGTPFSGSMHTVLCDF